MIIVPTTPGNPNLEFNKLLNPRFLRKNIKNTPTRKTKTIPFSGPTSIQTIEHKPKAKEEKPISIFDA